jgi:hypothetical protein
MDRLHLADKMILFLEDRINCDNVNKYHEEFFDSTIEENSKVDKLIINKKPVLFTILYYDNSQEEWKKELFQRFDFMTEANYTGYSYFPYLYGVLDCYNQDKGKIYVYYEFFEGTLTELINNIEHPSDWYDICFQLVLINYYINQISKISYKNAIPQNHLFRKYPKPFYQKYELENYEFNINHKFLIVLWNFDLIYSNNNQVENNIGLLIEYLEKNKNSIKIMPSNRIIKMLNEINKTPEKAISILSEYYISK